MMVRRAETSRDPALGRLQGELGVLLEILQGADAPPSTQAVAAVRAADQSLAKLLEQWRELKDQEVKTLNEQLRQANLPILSP